MDERRLAGAAQAAPIFDEKRIFVSKREITVEAERRVQTDLSMQARPQVLQPAVYALDAEVWRYAKVPGWCVLLWVSRNF